jgi:hypothetical protein
MAGLTDADLVDRAEYFWSRMSEFGEDQPADQPLIPSGEKNMDPTLIAAGVKLLGSAMGGSMPATSSASNYTNLNNSNWTVATSGSKANGGLDLPWYVWVIGGVVAIKFFKKRKG